ncbi:putative amidohydrolase YhaA [Marinithermofilum abyssi]|uniref:Putative amidohydrolase YhaA n=1 Tax=Marinithermofilum abyssi TaxID=1571185 RepID=A0A8J2YAT4_9BACL|nr:M20 family metallopeptidase [Marinithermofilum abyssi]GGE19471.1 putative amidohydrolase YhaA [Marinithermofilum abyssi]
MTNPDRVKQSVDQLFPQMVEWRQYFHQYPELSFHEEKTSTKVADILRKMGYPVQTGVGGFGVTAVLEGAKAGRTIALRADMDALPIQDEKECEYRSQVPGVMHACGHDAHMSVLLATAALLKGMREHILGRVVFLFQPAEEMIPGGARDMIGAGVLEGVDAVYGIHLWTPLPTGVVGLKQGPLMAASDSFAIEVKGKGGHGGLPHESVDAIAIASHLIVNLQSIVSRQVDPLKSGVISIGTIEGGKAFNVIADRCSLKGTVRTFDPQVREWIQRRIGEVAEQTCRMYGAECNYQYGWGYPAVVNHPVEAHRMAEAARSFLGNEQVWEIAPVMAGEDFAYYLQQRPGAFCFVGAGNPDLGAQYPHHHPRFDLDESAMKIAVELFIRTVMKELGEGLS